MTLPAVDTWAVRGLSGLPKYKVGPNCSNPTCGRLAEHAHHIVRRSAIGGDYAWIEIDGTIVANKTGVCPRCHDDLTGNVGGHKAAIRWVEHVFWWSLVAIHPNNEIEYHSVAPIEPQPPTLESLAERPGIAESEHCPMCGQTKRRRRSSASERRRRKTWTVKVPDEVVEDGAIVLDSLVDNLAPMIPNADSSATGRYYVIVAALAHALMDTKALAASLSGRGG